MKTMWWVKLADKTKDYADTNDAYNFYNAMKHSESPTTNTTAPVKLKVGTRLIKENEGYNAVWPSTSHTFLTDDLHQVTLFSLIHHRGPPKHSME